MVEKRGLQVLSLDRGKKRNYDCYRTCGLDILLRETPLTSQILKYILQFIRQTLKRHLLYAFLHHTGMPLPRAIIPA